MPAGDPEVKCGCCDNIAITSKGAAKTNWPLLMSEYEKSTCKSNCQWGPPDPRDYNNKPAYWSADRNEINWGFTTPFFYFSKPGWEAVGCPCYGPGCAYYGGVHDNHCLYGSVIKFPSCRSPCGICSEGGMYLDETEKPYAKWKNDPSLRSQCIELCTVNGAPGNGSEQGTCRDGEVCEKTGECRGSCATIKISSSGSASSSYAKRYLTEYQRQPGKKYGKNYYKNSNNHGFMFVGTYWMVDAPDAGWRRHALYFSGCKEPSGTCRAGTGKWLDVGVTWVDDPSLEVICKD